MRMTPEAHSQVWILGRMIWEGSGVSLEEEVCPWGGLSGFKTQCHSQLVLSDSCYWTKVWALSSYTFPVCCHDVSTLSLWHGESQTTSKLSWSWCFTKMIEKELRSILTQYALFYPHKYTSEDEGIYPLWLMKRRTKDVGIYASTYTRQQTHNLISCMCNDTPLFCFLCSI